MFKFGKRSINNLKGLHPQLVEFANELIKISPYDFTIIEGIRTVEKQKSLFQQGRTQPGKTITNCDGLIKKSKHQIQKDGYGHAFDIVILINNQATWNSKLYDNLGKVAGELLKKYNVIWGGNWKNFKDRPHFQIS